MDDNEKYQKKQKDAAIQNLILAIVVLILSAVVMTFFPEFKSSPIPFIFFLSICMIIRTITEWPNKNAIMPGIAITEKYRKKIITLGFFKESITIDDEKKTVSILGSVNGGKKKATFENSKNFEFSELIDFELMQDNNTIIKSNALKTGAVVEALNATKSKKDEKYCNSMKIKLNIDSLNNSVIYIDIINSKTEFDSDEYKDIKNNIEELLGVFKYIENKNKKLQKKSDSN